MTNNSVNQSKFAMFPKVLVLPCELTDNATKYVTQNAIYLKIRLTACSTDIPLTIPPLTQSPSIPTYAKICNLLKSNSFPIPPGHYATNSAVLKEPNTLLFDLTSSSLFAFDEAVQSRIERMGSIFMRY